MINGNHFPPKDPAEKLDYVFDWAAEKNNNGMTNWLQDDETIESYTVNASTGITIVTSSLINSNTSVLVWISGGEDGTDYTITCEITTASRTGVRRAILPVKQQ